ncbi:MAG: type II toxin-antitoxin system Phd/YefM family antitoxin [Dermatophilaceae bacterium]
MTGREFNQRPSQVKRAAEKEPVVITEHDRPSYVLMTYAEFQRLHRAPADLAAWLEMGDGDSDIDLEVEPIGQWIEPARW